MSNEFHSSASDINLFLIEPASWIIKHLFDYRGAGGAAASRGLAVEFGLTAHLTQGEQTKNADLVEVADPVYNEISPTDRTPLGFAQYKFRQLTAGEISDEIEDEYRNIAPMLKQAMAAFANTGTLLQTQRKVEPLVEGVPLLGFLDFVYPDSLVDLKTTKAIPSKPRPTHVLQMAIYTHATGLPARLCYVSAKKFAWYDVTAEETEKAMAQVRAACRAIRRIRQHGNLLDTAEFYPPKELSSFYYDPVSRHLAAEIWKL